MLNIVALKPMQATNAVKENQKGRAIINPGNLRTLRIVVKHAVTVLTHLAWCPALWVSGWLPWSSYCLLETQWTFSKIRSNWVLLNNFSCQGFVPFPYCTVKYKPQFATECTFSRKQHTVLTLCQLSPHVPIPFGGILYQAIMARFFLKKIYFSNLERC